MIIHLKHDEIDKEKWDICVSNSPGTKPYGYSWYLDIMTPEWEALVDDDYVSVFPLPVCKKYGIRYITTPVFLQQLGVYSRDILIPQAVNEYLEKIPDFYRFIDLCICQQINHPGFITTARTDYMLDLSTDYEILYKNFSRNCKRNIAASLQNKPEFAEDVKPAELVRLFLSNKGKDIKDIKLRHYKCLENLMEYCVMSKQGRIISVRNELKELIFGLFFIEINLSKTMIFLVNTNESHNKRIGHFVYNELIKESAGSGAFFDFAGSSIPSIAFFMESFGSRNYPYYRIYRNRLQWPIRIFK
jgi:hypothetical protein